MTRNAVYSLSSSYVGINRLFFWGETVPRYGGDYKSIFFVR